MANALNIRLVLDGDQFRAELRNSSGEVERFAATAKQGGDTAASSFAQTQRAAASLLAVIGGVAAIRAFTSSFIEAADVQGRMMSQVQRVTRSQGEYNAVMSRMSEIADDAYVSINSVSEIYVRSIEPMRQLGRTTKDTLDLTEAVSLSLVVSSANVEKQAAAINALSKVMQTGKAEMDDMMSLIIASPRFVEALEAALGKTRAQLLEMVSAGKLTAAEITAVSSQIGLLRAEVEAMPTELVDAMVRLQNGFQQWAGETNAQLGLTAKLVTGVELLTANLDTMASVLGTVAVATGTVFGGRALSSLAAYAAKQSEAIIASSAMRDMERAAAAEAVRAAEARVVAARQTEAQVASQLRLVRSAVASAEAQHALAASNLIAAQRHADAARSAGAQSFALRELAVAETRLATAQRARAGAYASLAGLDAASSRMQRELASAHGNSAVQTDALSSANRRLAGALTGTQAAIAAVGRAGSAVFTAIGGWVTVALAAAYGVYQLGDALFNGSAEAKDAVASLRRVNAEMLLTRERADLIAQGVPEALTGVALAAKSVQDEIAGASARMHEFGAVDVMPVVAMWNAIANQIRQSGIDELQAELDTFTDSLIRNTIEADDFSAAYQENLGVLRALGVDTTAFIQKLEGLAITFGRTATEANTLANATSAFSESTEKFLSATYERVGALGLSQEAMIRHRAAQAAMAAATDVERIAINKAADAEIEAIRVNDLRTRSLESGKKATEDRIKLAADYIQSLEEQVATYGLVGRAAARHTLETLTLSDAQRAQAVQLLDLIDEWERYAPVVQRALAAVESLQSGNGDLSAQIASLRGQLQGLTPAQIEFNAALAAANVLYAEALVLGPPTAQAQAAYELRLRQLTEIRDLKNQIDSSQAAVQAAEESTRAWSDFAEGLGRAVLDGSKGVKRYFKQLLDDLKAQLISSGLLRIFASIFGGTFTGAASAGNQGGSLSMLGQMFGLGGGGGGGGGFNMYGSSTPWLAAAGGAYYGLTERGSGGVSSLAAGAAYGGLGYVGGSLALGALGGAGAATAATAGAGAYAAGSAAVGGAAAGASTAAMAIPIIGWVLAIAALVDMFSGGKLFGTKFRPESATASLAIGAEGASASTSLTEVRQRSLFRGRTWRTREIESGDEAIEAATQLWESINEVMVNSARQLKGEAPDVIEAALRTVTEFDKKGRVKATTYFVDMLGRSWEEATAEAAATRIAAESIIATIDSVLGTTVTAAAAAAGQELIDGLGDGLAGAGQVGENAGRIIGDAIGNVIPKTGDGAALQGEASAIAERWRGDAEALMEGAQFLLTIATDLRGGFDLLGTGTLTPIVDLVDELAVGGESLVQAYQRIGAATSLLDDALEMSGVALSGTREELVRFAVDIAAAAGGINRAQQLWSTYFTAFFSEQERAALGLSRAQGAAASEAEDIGLSYTDFAGDGGMAAWRALFEQQLPSLSAEAVVQWLEFGEALAAANASQAAYNATLGETARDSQAISDIMAELKWDGYLAGLSELDRELAESDKRFNDAVAAARDAGASESELAEIRRMGAAAAARIGEAAAAEELEELAAATERYQGIVRSLQDELDAGRLSPFQIAVRDIVRWAASATDELQDAARAAGRASAAESELDLVRQVATLRLAEAVRQLRDAARSLVEQLQGSPLQQIEQQITAAQSAASAAQVSAIDEVGQAAAEMWRAQRAAIDSIREYLDGQLLGDLSSLTPAQRLAEAQRQFDTAAAAAASGDAAALGDLPRLADILLREGRDYYASGEEFSAIEAAVRAMLQQLVGLDIGSEPAAGGSGAAGQVGVSPELQALYEQRDELLLQLEEENRRQLAEQLAIMLRDLVAGTGTSLGEVAASIGLSMSGLIADLGINLGTLTAETATSLAGVARTLGVDLAELAAEVGVDLGSLADRQSLLNQALDGTLAGVPEDIRAQLLGPLDALRSAVTDADATAAMASLVIVTDDLPSGIRDLLAPFFSEIDPTPVITELGTLRDLYDLGGQQLAESVAQTSYLQSIAEAMRASNAASDIPGYEVGTGYVPRTGIALLHQGEAVLPAPVADFFRREALPLPTGGGTDVVQELRALRREQTQQARDIEEALRRIETAERDGSARVSDTFRLAADAARSNR
jgi:tape measure domain-containing protein